MLNGRFGRKTYVEVTGDENEARKQGEELKREAMKKKFFFQQKLVLEGKRKHLGKGNIATFLVENAKQGIEHSFVNKMLRISGFEVADIMTIKLNDFRVNQVEVLFAPEVNIDTQVIETKLRDAGMDVMVSKFEYAEECLMIYAANF